MNTQQKVRKCSRCGGTDHYRGTCEAGEDGSNPEEERPRMEGNFDGQSFVKKMVTPRKMRKVSTNANAGEPSSAPSTSAAAGSKRKANANAGEPFVQRNVTPRKMGKGESKVSTDASTTVPLEKSAQSTSSAAAESKRNANANAGGITINQTFKNCQTVTLNQTFNSAEPS